MRRALCLPRRCWSSSSSSSSQPARVRRGSVDFSNTKDAFRSKTFSEMLRHYVVYKAFSYNSLVDNAHKLVTGSQRLLGRRLFEWLMKRTVYGQFVAGEDLRTIRPVISELSASGVSSILDYAVEQDRAEEEEEDENGNGGSREVVLEQRKKKKKRSNNGDDGLSPHPTDPQLYPQFEPSLSPVEATYKASARTFLYEGEEKCDKNVEHFRSCIETAAKATERGSPFAAIKITSLGRVEFLLKLSEVLVGTQEVFQKLADSADLLDSRITPESFHTGLRNMGVHLKEAESERLFRELDTDGNGHIDVFEWGNHFQPGKALHRKLQTKKPLLAVMDKDDQQQMQAVLQRAMELGEYARESGVRLMVDAEQTYFQPAIRYITVNNLMPKFNQSTPIIYNTTQCYLKGAESALRLDVALAERNGFTLGVKLVRGAYMEQERDNATKKGYPDPIWSDKAATDRCYHHLLQWLLAQVAAGKVHVMVASHNEDTVRFAIEKMEELGIDKSEGSVVFGQLLGMCDHITFPLGQAGYCAYKYMPYSPVKDALPYLLRRANENRSMLTGSVPLRERTVVATEIKRRLFRPWR